MRTYTTHVPNKAHVAEGRSIVAFAASHTGVRRLKLHHQARQKCSRGIQKQRNAQLCSNERLSLGWLHHSGSWSWHHPPKVSLQACAGAIGKWWSVPMNGTVLACTLNLPSLLCHAFHSYSGPFFSICWFVESPGVWTLQTSLAVDKEGHYTKNRPNTTRGAEDRIESGCFFW